MHVALNRQKSAISYLIILITLLLSCRSAESGKTVVVKPKYHHSWYKNHIYKKKWRIGRIKFEPEKQGVKKVKMKN